VCSLALLANCKIYQPLTALSAREAFEEYCTFWNKTHATAEEKQERFGHFVTAGIRIAKLNAHSQNAKFGYTKFADWSDEEFKSLNGFVPSANKVYKTIQKRAVHQNAAIDWVAKGMTTPIKNQQQCGSCWAFSAVETIESANLLAGKPQTIGAPQEIVDCDSGEQGCNGGDPRQAMQWVQSQGGLELESCYPYAAEDETCAQSKCSPSPNLSVSAVNPVAEDESQIYQALTQSPLSICCDASQWQYYSSGVLAASQCGLSIDHAIQLTGYSPSQGGYWVVRNSWGADWGENGFIYLQYGQNTCGITSEVTGATA